MATGRKWQVLRIVAFSFLVASLGSWKPTWADEPASEKEQKAEKEQKTDSEASSEDVDRWIRQLDAPEFTQRQDATVRLRRLGPSVFPKLVEAAKGTSRERTARAVQILEFHYRNGSDEAKQEAKKALEEIAQSSSGPVARQARSILTPDKSKASPGARPAPNRAAQAAAILRLRAMRGAALPGRTVTVTNVNGTKTITITEKDKTVKLFEEPKGKITLTVKEKKNGKARVKVYQAKSAEELKKKDAQAYKIYQMAKKEGQGGIQIQIGPGPGGMGPAPGGLGPGAPAGGMGPGAPAGLQAQKPAKPGAARKGLKDAVRRLEQTIEKLEQAKPGDQEAVKKAAEELRKLQKELERLSG